MADLLNNPTDSAGVLQQLQMRMMQAPQAREGLIQQRNAAQQNYQQQLQQMPPQDGGLGMAVQEYLARYAKAPGMAPSTLMAGAVAAAPGLEREQWMADQKRREAAAGAGYDMADKNLKEEDLYSTKMTATLGRNAKMAQLGPEKTSGIAQTVYANLSKEINDRYPNMPFEERKALIETEFPTRFNMVFDTMALAGANMPGRAPVTPGAQPAATTITEPKKEDVVATTAPPTGDSERLDAPTEAALNKIKNDGAIASNTAVSGSDSDTIYALKQEWDTADKIVKMFANNPTSKEYTDALRNQQEIAKELRTLGVSTPSAPLATQAVSTAQPSAKVVSTTNVQKPKTAIEAGTNPEFTAQLKTSVFAPDMADIPPRYTSRMTKEQENEAQKSRDAFVASPMYKDVTSQAAAAKEINKLVELAIETKSNPNALSGITKVVDSYASALGLDLSDKKRQELREYVKNDQVSKALGLAMQLLQVGVQTDKDFQRNIQSTYSPDMTDDQIRAVMRQYGDVSNERITKERFLQNYLQNPNSKGQEQNWENYYQSFNARGVPKSVWTPDRKVLPFEDAANKFWNTEVGSKYKPSAKDDDKVAMEKHAATLKALKKTDAAMRAKLSQGEK